MNDHTTDRCPGEPHCLNPDTCIDCNPAIDPYTTGASIAAAAKLARDYLTEGHHEHATNALAMLDKLETLCAAMPTKKALHDVIRGHNHWVKADHRKTTRELTSTPDQRPATATRRPSWTD